MSTVWTHSACHSYGCRRIPRRSGLEKVLIGLDWPEYFKLQTIFGADTRAPRCCYSFMCEMYALWLTLKTPQNLPQC
jgi:hypothetical protein